MRRIYTSVKGLQAFYPTAEALQREHDQLPDRKGLDFIPLEIFLDVKSEATDYDRIVSKTDAAFSYDRFNHLRMPRGLDWPHAKDAWGQDIQHLRLHQVSPTTRLCGILTGRISSRLSSLDCKSRPHRSTTMRSTTSLPTCLCTKIRGIGNVRNGSTISSLPLTGRTEILIDLSTICSTSNNPSGLSQSFNRVTKPIPT